MNYPRSSGLFQLSVNERFGFVLAARHLLLVDFFSFSLNSKASCSVASPDLVDIHQHDPRAALSHREARFTCGCSALETNTNMTVTLPTFVTFFFLDSHRRCRMTAERSGCIGRKSMVTARYGACGRPRATVPKYTSSKCAGVEEELEDETKRSH